MATLIFDVPAGTPKSKCSSCGAVVFWIKTASGKNMPVNEKGESHFSDCPNAANHRRPRRVGRR